MFETKTAFPMFPTILWSFKLPEATANRVNGEVSGLLDRLIAAAPHKGNRSFFQTEHDLHTLPEMQELTGIFMAALDEVIRNLAPTEKEMEITGCWGNVHPSNSAHAAHSHPNNFLSGVYYVTVPESGHQITFYDPRLQHYIISPAVERSNGQNSEHVFFEVEEGLLVIFPSWLAHSVPARNTDARRTSIAYNFNFKDFNARIAAPIWQANVPTHPSSA